MLPIQPGNVAVPPGGPASRVEIGPEARARLLASRQAQRASEADAAHAEVEGDIAWLRASATHLDAIERAARAFADVAERDAKRARHRR